MNQKFVATKVQNGNVSIEIDQIQYEKIQKSTNLLLDLLTIESLNRIVIESYIQLEMSLMEHSFKHMCFLEDESMYYFKERVTFERNLSSFLSSCRKFLDQTCKILHKIDREYSSDHFQNFKNEKSNQYDTVLSYRFMEGLRNSTQHNCMVISRVMPGWSRKEIDGIDYKEFSTIIELDVPHLRDNSSVKQTILNEIDLTGNLDLRFHTKVYVQSLYKAHDAIRKSTNLVADDAIKSIKEIHKAILDSGEDSLLGVCVCIFDHKGCRVDRVDLAEHFVDTFQTARNTCAGLTTGSSYVTSFTKHPPTPTNPSP